MKKRILSFITVLFLITAIMPMLSNKANATTNTYSISPSTNEISKVVYLTIYYSFNNNNYKVIYKNGSYYVQFKNGDNIVNVKWPTMCPAKTVNDFSYTNNKLSKSISSRSNYDGREVYQLFSEKYDKNTGVSYDHWNMIYLQASGSYSNGKITLKCKNLSGLRITFASKYKYGNTYYKPKNCAQYKKCLHIYKTSGAIQITPKWDIGITKPGKNKNILSTFSVSGLGYANKTTDIDTLFNIYYTTKAITTSTTPSLIFANLYSLYKQGADLHGSRSKGYNTGETYLLSKNKGSSYYKCMKASFVAPLNIIQAKDFYEVDVYLNERISSKSPLTEIKIILSVSKSVQKY